MYQKNKIVEINPNLDHVCKTAIIVEDNHNILKHYGNMMLLSGINHKLFLNGNDALDYINSIQCDLGCKILV